MNDMADKTILAKGTDSPSAADHGGSSPFRFSNKLATLVNPGSIKAESISALCSYLLSQHVSEGKRSLALCAPSAGTGCSYITANLAVAMSQAGVNTLVIDANLRDPAMQDYFAPPADTPGLLQCLDRPRMDLGDAICSDILPGLSILYGGGTSDNVQDMLSSSAFVDIAASCMRDFDLVLIDTPPANSYADARRVANVMHYAMVIVRQNGSYVSDVKKLAKDLADDKATVIGTFMNDY